jgi:hypothetical protein
VGGSSACEQACRRDAPSPSPRPTDRRLGGRAQRRRRAARACALASVDLSTGPPTTGAPPAPGGVVVGRHLDAPFCALVSLWLACCRAPRAVKAARLQLHPCPSWQTLNFTIAPVGKPSKTPLPGLATNLQLHHCPSWQTLKNTLARIGYKPLVPLPLSPLFTPPSLAARRPSVSPRVFMRAAVPDYHPACRPLPTAPPAPSSLHPTTTAPPSPPLYTHTAPPASVCSPRWAPPPIFPHRIFCGVFPLDPFRGFLTQMGWQGAHATKHPCSCQMSRGRDPQCNYHQSIFPRRFTIPTSLHTHTHPFFSF